MSDLWCIGRSKRLVHYNSKLAYGRPFGFPELNLLSSMKLPSRAYAQSPVDHPMRLEFLELLPTHGLVALELSLSKVSAS